jgi:hypothetical protein
LALEALNKSQVKEIQKLAIYHKLGDMQDTVALALSALIRASRTKAQHAALMEYADLFGVKNHKEFIV